LSSHEYPQQIMSPIEIGLDDHAAWIAIGDGVGV
jgi:hypothetical protein